MGKLVWLNGGKRELVGELQPVELVASGIFGGFCFCDAFMMITFRLIAIADHFEVNGIMAES